MLELVIREMGFMILFGMVEANEELKFNSQFLHFVTQFI
jgi:hypothetical protein